MEQGRRRQQGDDSEEHRAHSHLESLSQVSRVFPKLLESLSQEEMSAFAPLRLKKMMQRDEEVGNIRSDVFPVLSRAMELLATELVQKAAQNADKQADAVIQRKHM